MAQLVKNPPAMRETWVQSMGWKAPLEKERLPTPVSGLENLIDCIVHGIAKSWTQLSDFHFHFFLEKGMATLSIILAQGIKWTEELGKLQSM